MFWRTQVGEPGLQVCPGREATTDYAHGDTWYEAEPQEGCILVNIGAQPALPSVCNHHLVSSRLPTYPTSCRLIGPLLNCPHLNEVAPN